MRALFPLPLILTLAGLTLALGIRRLPMGYAAPDGEGRLSPGLHLRGFTPTPARGFTLFGRDVPALRAQVDGRRVEARVLVAWALEEGAFMTPAGVADRLGEALEASLSRGALESLEAPQVEGLRVTRVDVISLSFTPEDEAALLAQSTQALEAGLRSLATARAAAQEAMSAAQAQAKRAASAARASWSERRAALEAEVSADIARGALEAARWRRQRRAVAEALEIERRAEIELIEAEVWALERATLARALNQEGGRVIMTLEAIRRLEEAGEGGVIGELSGLAAWRRLLGFDPVRAGSAPPRAPR